MSNLRLTTSPAASLTVCVLKIEILLNGTITASSIEDNYNLTPANKMSVLNAEITANSIEIVIVL